MRQPQAASSLRFLPLGVILEGLSGGGWLV